MTVYRITNSHYKDDISGNGAKIRGARWNMRGTGMLYTAENISLSTLELLVHIGFSDIQDFYHLLAISIPDDAPLKEIRADKLKANWQEDEDYTAFMGTSFLREKFFRNFISAYTLPKKLMVLTLLFLRLVLATGLSIFSDCTPGIKLLAPPPQLPSKFLTGTNGFKIAISHIAPGAASDKATC